MKFLCFFFAVLTLSNACKFIEDMDHPRPKLGEPGLVRIDEVLWFRTFIESFYNSLSKDTRVGKVIDFSSATCYRSNGDNFQINFFLAPTDCRKAPGFAIKCSQRDNAEECRVDLKAFSWARSIHNDEFLSRYDTVTVTYMKCFGVNYTKKNPDAPFG